MIIGDRLRALREEKKLSQGNIEKRTGLLRPYISRLAAAVDDPQWLAANTSPSGVTWRRTTSWTRQLRTQRFILERIDKRWPAQ